MDDGVEAAVSGDRVGLALRNLREEALHRGCIIVHPNGDAPIRHDKSNLVLERAPFQKRQVALDDVIHAAVDLQFVVGRVTAVEGDSITVEWESPLWIRSIGSPSIIITQLDAMPMRIMGCVERIEVA
jgi:selenocysteine-specific translation elongation factor